MVNPSIIAAPHKSGDDYKQIKKYFNKWIIPSSPVMLNIVDLRDVAPAELLGGEGPLCHRHRSKDTNGPLPAKVGQMG